MSDLTTIRQQATDYAKRANEADMAEKYEEAHGHYMQCLDYFLHLIKYEKNKSLVTLYNQKMSQYMKRAEYIKERVLNKQKPEEAGGSGEGGASVQAKKKKKKGESGDSDDEDKTKMQGALSSAIVTEKPNVKWSDVSGLEQAKQSLQEAVILPIRLPHLFDETRKPWRGILLYGPPGTGKSYLAKACATECDGTFFSVSSSDLVSKYVGESERLVANLFEMAREKRPSIVFIDEVDSLCGARSEGENDSSRRIKTEFLVQMQGVGNDMDGVLVLGATNTPWELDNAIRRRFEKRIYISLPEAAARVGIFKKETGKTKHNLTEEDWITLGEGSQGYSGSDLSVVTKEALFLPVRRITSAKHFKKQADGTFVPTYPSDPDAQEMGYMDIEPKLVQTPLVTLDDYMQALAQIKPSVCDKDIEEHIKWTHEFGQEC